MIATVTQFPTTNPIALGREMPHAIPAEQALLGALLLNNKAYEKVSEFLRADHFYQPAHGRIYETIGKLIDRGQLANFATLEGYFSKDEDLLHLGGAHYLQSLLDNVLTTTNTEDYGQAIYDCFLRRELIGVGEQTVMDAGTMKIDVGAQQLIEDAEKKLFNLAVHGNSDNAIVRLDTVFKQAIDFAETSRTRGSAIVGVTTGLIDVDKKLGGLHRSDLIILAGRPGMGKTALASCMAFNAALKHLKSGGKEGAVVGFFSLEMSAEQLATRILSERCSIGVERIRRGEIKQTDISKFIEVARDLQTIPLFIDDTPSLSLMALRTRARRLKRQHNLGLIVIDYLQIMMGSGSRQSESNRVMEVAELSRGLKALAKELNVPVLALSQLSRSNEKRDDPRPMLSDLRDSGSIEQDADLVLFVHRDEYYMHREQPKQKSSETGEQFQKRMEIWQAAMEKVYNLADVLIAKNRHGPTGDVTLQFTGEFARFDDLDRTHTALPA